MLLHLVDDLDNEQAANTNVEDSSCDTLRLESGHYDRRQTLQTTAKDTMNHDLSLQPEKKRKCNPANLKVQVLLSMTLI